MKPFFKLLALITISTALSAHAAIMVDGIKLEGKEVINGVTLHNAISGKTRIIHALQEKTYSSDADTVFKLAKMFDQKCNNDYAKKRKYADKNMSCLFFNENLIESVEIKNIKKNYTPLKNEIERFIVKRRIYNTGTFSYNDLILIEKYKNDKNQKVYEITHKLISEKETKKYIDNPIEHNSVFNEMIGTYKIIELAPQKTKVIYTYVSKTDHWMLRRDIVIGKIYNNTAKGTAFALNSLQIGIDKKLIKN